MESVPYFLPTASVALLGAIFLLIVLQEAANGFHDTANAVATAIYSNALKPMPAVSIAAFGNFLGVLLGGTAVAFALVYLLPKEMVAGINTVQDACLMLSLVFTAFCWNVGTWWFGIPNSTTHAYIGSIIGVSIAHAVLNGTPVAEAINWHQGSKVLITLLLSPAIGFLLGYLVLLALRTLVKDPSLYRPAETDERPPSWIRGLLISGTAGVSFLHGSNDGQKSIGLMMIVLFGLFPANFGLNPSRLSDEGYAQGLHTIDSISLIADKYSQDEMLGHGATRLQNELQQLRSSMEAQRQGQELDEALYISMRSKILVAHETLSKLMKNGELLERFTSKEIAILNQSYRQLSNFIQYVPLWVILISATALGIGTAVGYKKIVTTLGEKLGSSRMNPAQGTAAQAAAMASIALADFGGMPVSTTHVLSSGVVGAVTATPGDKVQSKSIAKIAITWITTLPGTVILSFVMAIVFASAVG